MTRNCPTEEAVHAHLREAYSDQYHSSIGNIVGKLFQELFRFPRQDEAISPILIKILVSYIISTEMHFIAKEATCPLSEIEKIYEKYALAIVDIWVTEREKHA